MATPSPTCTINSGSTPADVAAGASVSGALANPAGANFWFLAAISADDLLGASGLATLQASLAINQTNKTFSFTAPPSLGEGVIFMSTVGVSSLSTLGAGRDVNGNIVPAFTTTFKVNVPTSGGNRVIVVGEVLEQSTYAGWLAEINAAIRGFSSSAVGSVPLRKAGNYVIQPTDPVDIWMDTSSSVSGYSLTFPSGPTDGQLRNFKDNHAGGSWSVSKPCIATGNTGQKVELPTALGTYTAAAGTVNLTVAGGSITYKWGQTEGAWLVY